MSSKPVTDSVLKHQSFHDAVPETAKCLMKLTNIQYYYSHVQECYVLIHVRSTQNYVVRVGADESEWLNAVHSIVKNTEADRARRLQTPT